MQKRNGVVAMSVVAVIGAATSLADVNFFLTTEFSGGVAPAGPGPYLHAEFKDVVGGVELTLTSLLLGNSEFVKEWDFNLDPALNPTELSFALQTGGPAATISTGVNAFKADGDGRYDIKVEFPVAPPGARFNGSDSVTYFITSSQAISAASFDFLSHPDGGHGPFTTAAHVLGTGGGEESGWITVPEPSTIGLLALGLVIAGRRFAKRG